MTKGMEGKKMDASSSGGLKVGLKKGLGSPRDVDSPVNKGEKRRGGARSGQTFKGARK